MTNFKVLDIKASKPLRYKIDTILNLVYLCKNKFELHIIYMYLIPAESKAIYSSASVNVHHFVSCPKLDSVNIA